MSIKEWPRRNQIVMRTNCAGWLMRVPVKATLCPPWCCLLHWVAFNWWQIVEVGNSSSTERSSYDLFPLPLCFGGSKDVLFLRGHFRKFDDQRLEVFLCCVNASPVECPTGMYAALMPHWNVCHFPVFLVMRDWQARTHACIVWHAHIYTSHSGTHTDTHLLLSDCSSIYRTPCLSWLRKSITFEHRKNKHKICNFIQWVFTWLIVEPSCNKLSYSSWELPMPLGHKPIIIFVSH